MGNFILIRLKWSLRATKSVTQSHSSERLRSLLAECLNMTYNAVHYAEEHGIENRRGMKGFYRTLKDVKLPSCYKVASMTRACAVVRSRKKTRKRGVAIGRPKPLKPAVCIMTGFFITMKGRLFFRISRDEYFDVQLDPYSLKNIANKNVRSLTIASNSGTENPASKLFVGFQFANGRPEGFHSANVRPRGRRSQVETLPPRSVITVPTREARSLWASSESRVATAAPSRRAKEIISSSGLPLPSGSR